MSNEDFVSVPVPASRVMEVYALLARPAGEVALEQGEPVVPAAAAGGGAEWTVADFGRILRDHRESSRRVAQVIDVLAARPDEAVSLGELEEGTGIDRMQIRGALSGFTRICREFWPGHPVQGIWPMRNSWGRTEQANQDGEAHYTLPAVYSERWKQARQS